MSLSNKNNLTTATINGWPGFYLVKDGLSVGVVPPLGGRIMSIVVEGEEQLFSLSPDEAAHGSTAFPVYGGDKTWIAPEWAWVNGRPSPDLDAGSYVLSEEQGWTVMTSPVCSQTGLRIRRRLRLQGQGYFSLVEELHNTTDRAVRRGIWNVTQIKRPFDVYTPGDTGQMRSYHLQDATLPDPGQALVPVGLWSRIECRSAQLFKFGGIPSTGKLVTIKEAGTRTILFSRAFEFKPDTVYAHASAIEVFNASAYPYGEVEVHGPLVDIPPQGTVSLAQRWHFETIPGLVSVGDIDGVLARAGERCFLD